MKKILILFLFLITFGIKAQIVTPVTSGMTGTQVRSAINGSLSNIVLMRDTLTYEKYYVNEYGAIPDDANDDQAGIQAAINAAYSVAGGVSYLGGTVIIPAGIYKISGPILLKSYINIEIDKGAKFLIASSYAGNVWYANAGLRNCYLSGGTYYCATKTPTILNLESDGTAQPILMNRFENINIIGCNYGVDFIVKSDGWINDNIFSNWQIWSMVSGIKYTQSTPGQIDGNIFNSCVFQYDGSGNCIGMDTLTGSYNQFNSIVFWDFPTPSKTMKLVATGSGRNTFLNITGITSGYAIQDSSLTENNNFFTSDNLLFLGKRDIKTAGNIYSSAETHVVSENAYINPAGFPPCGVNSLGRFLLYEKLIAIDLVGCNPQIKPGENGQLITIIASSDTYTITFHNGNGIKLKSGSTLVLGYCASATFMYSTTLGLWVQL